MTGPAPRPLKDRIIEQARAEGFAALGFCRPDAIPDAPARLKAFIDEGRHGQMGWMADRMHWRADPAALWPDARTLIMLAEPYTPPDDPLAVLGQPDRAAISVYAGGKDYHDLVKKRLKRLGRWLIERAGGEIKVFADTAPVMEKALAQAAGLGWQGKHTNLLSRDLGNWFFLGALFTTLEIDPDPPGEDHCGSCTACMDVCPTRAIRAPYELDARLCISYLTIEHKGPIDEDLRPLLANRIYGCDDCLAACPWNKFAAAASETGYASRFAEPPRLADLVKLDDAGFRALFSGSPIKRTGRDRFVRNVLYAIGNSGDAGLSAEIEPLLADPDPTIADAARWAKARLNPA